jgi:hypothetical protein
MESEPKPPPSAPVGTSKKWDTCGICGSSAIVFDGVRDFNICLDCGAHQTTRGWDAGWR